MAFLLEAELVQLGKEGGVQVHVHQIVESFRFWVAKGYRVQSEEVKAFMKCAQAALEHCKKRIPHQGTAPSAQHDVLEGYATPVGVSRIGLDKSLRVCSRGRTTDMDMAGPQSPVHQLVGKRNKSPAMLSTRRRGIPMDAITAVQVWLGDVECQPMMNLGE